MENENDVLGEELPNLHRRGKFGKGFWVGTALVVISVGAACIYALNTPKKVKKAKVAQEKSVTSLPPLVVPKGFDEPEKQQVDQKQVEQKKKEEKNGKKVVTWEDRKMKPGRLITGGGGGSGGSEQAANQKPDMDESSADDELALSLKPTKTVGVSASKLPDRNYLITKGTSIDCVLSEALNTTLPGITTCTSVRDVYSDNGNVVLMERGTEFVGDVGSNTKRGQRRAGVLWTRAKTPLGIAIDLNSLSADDLGRTGIPAEYDNHFWERFNAAIMISLLDTTSQIIGNNIVGGSGGGTRNFFGGGGGGGSGGTAVVRSILQQDANIRATLDLVQGTRLKIKVTRDLDFSKVYTLKVKP